MSRTAVELQTKRTGRCQSPALKLINLLVNQFTDLFVSSLIYVVIHMIVCSFCLL